MNCSNCEFAAKIKEAEHGGIRYEDTPCASCKLTEDSSHTMTFDEERAHREEDGGRRPEKRRRRSEARRGKATADKLVDDER